MVDEQVTQDAPAEDAPIPAAADTGGAQAIAAFMDWLCNRDQPAGPFGQFWGPEPGQALVKEFCDKQGW